MDFVSLSELNRLVKNALRESFPETYWVMAEMNDVKVNYASGHCYLELIEKSEQNGAITAKARAYIWKNVFQVLKPYFEEATGQSFVSGLKVLINVGVDFHEAYGYGLTIYDIEPSYTVGDIQRKRQQIIRQLQEDGVFSLNKELSFPLLPQRVAVISSPTAAGYEDFLDQLNHNRFGFVFYTKLFPAIMQGEQTESSVISALEKVYEHIESFDVLVIIRGGGASSDLASFDSYLLAAHCVQFPIPLITGIGHERDESILDMVAYRQTKTPTAVAEFLVGQLTRLYSNLNDLQQRLVHSSQSLISGNESNLQKLFLLFPEKTSRLLEKRQGALQVSGIQIKQATISFLEEKSNHLSTIEMVLKMSSPEYILSKGYTLTTKGGRIIKRKEELLSGDAIVTRFADGTVCSTVD